MPRTWSRPTQSRRWANGLKYSRSGCLHSARCVSPRNPMIYYFKTAETIILPSQLNNTVVNNIMSHHKQLVLLFGRAHAHTFPWTWLSRTSVLWNLPVGTAVWCSHCWAIPQRPLWYRGRGAERWTRACPLHPTKPAPVGSVLSQRPGGERYKQTWSITEHLVAVFSPLAEHLVSTWSEGKHRVLCVQAKATLSS